ncbi:hypothetical protein QE152_g8812 [Popillia japonica]|uniref:Uncharacterized protein n=1 Tax=Popillia japonica TaxID=7064 RepID=A0AAW1M1N3_POPJA
MVIKSTYFEQKDGQFLIDFAKEKGMVIKSTYFEQKDSRKGTWRSPDGSYTNQIDHVSEEKYGESQRDMEVAGWILHESNRPRIRRKIWGEIYNKRRGPDADTNYFLVGIKMKQEIPDERNKRRRNGREVQMLTQTTF